MNWKQKYRGLLAERDELLLEIAETEKNIERLKKVDKKYDRMEMEECEKARTAEYMEALYFRMPVKYINTVFFTHREQLMKKNRVCMDSRYLKKTLISESLVAHMAVFCEKAENTPDGPVLHLFEPFKSFKSQPLKLTYKEACEYEGHLLYVEIRVPWAGELPDRDTLKVESIKNTNMGLYGVLGKENPDESIDSISTELYNMIGRETEDVPEEMVEGVLTSIQNTLLLRQKSGNTLEINRICPTELRFIFHSEEEESVQFALYSVSYEDGQFFVRRENWHAGTGFNYGLWEEKNPGKKPGGLIEKWMGYRNQPEYKWRFCAEKGETEEFEKQFRHPGIQYPDDTEKE